MPTRILLASNNANKLAEIQDALGDCAVELVAPRDLNRPGPIPDPLEDGVDYLENARIKARVFAAWSGLPALADDSGLEIDALNGAPGLHSARFAGPGCSAADNVRKTLQELGSTPVAERGARFVCVLAVSSAVRDVLHVEGRCEGRITTEVRGARGFGYDPIFQPMGSEVTFAEMNRAEKRAISHRGLALLALRGRLETIGTVDLRR